MTSPDARVEKLQKLEQTMQSTLMQKQTFQTQLAEIENALQEVKKTDSNPFKIVGGIMVEIKKDVIEKELSEKKEMTELRIKTIEKQESKTTDDIKSVQEEVVNELKQEK